MIADFEAVKSGEALCGAKVKVLGEYIKHHLNETARTCWCGRLLTARPSGIGARASNVIGSPWSSAFPQTTWRCSFGARSRPSPRIGARRPPPRRRGQPISKWCSPRSMSFPLSSLIPTWSPIRRMQLTEHADGAEQRLRYGSLTSEALAWLRALGRIANALTPPISTMAQCRSFLHRRSMFQNNI